MRGVLQYKWEAYCDTNGRSTDSLSLSLEPRGTKSTAVQMGSVLRYKWEVYCDTFLRSSGGWGFRHSSELEPMERIWRGSEHVSWFVTSFLSVLVARAIRESIRANRFARIIRNWNAYFYSASGRFARTTRISDSRESPDSRESCESIRANHATKLSVNGAFDPPKVFR